MNTKKNMWNTLLKKTGQEVKIIRENVANVVFKEYNNANASVDDKIVFAGVNILNQGAILEYNNNKYLIIQEEETINNIYTKFIARRLDSRINIYINNKLQSIPCFIETSAQDVLYAGLAITTGNMRLTVQNNAITKQITENMRIIKWGYAWKVIAKTAEVKGLRYIYLEKTSTTEKDLIKDEIADYYKYNVKHNYVIKTNVATVELKENNTTELIATVTDNNTELENPTITYKSNNTDIAKIDDNGIVTGVKEGSTTISIVFTDAEGKELKKDIDVIVTKIKSNNTYSIEGDEVLMWTTNQIYKITDQNKNSSKSKFNFKIDYQESDTNVALLEVIDDTSCKITANDKRIRGNIVLIATDVESKKEIKKDIEIVGFFG
ncbi:Ig-like domain-containing protein [Clostridium tetani]|uniref:Ig-like domain-containing protein n=1 Tax=Clostridium tetani TaxID=1513 RepID=UPI0024A88FD0|nr:Ig-like domain-containing protein [Clostridium tetani]